MDDDTTYCIKRFRFDGPTTIVRINLTLDEAQEHCQDEATHGEGWFDGYDEQGPHHVMEYEHAIEQGLRFGYDPEQEMA